MIFSINSNEAIKNACSFCSDVAALLEDPSFSYEVWATELNFKIRSMVRMVSKGLLKITSNFVDRVAEQQKLNSNEKNYFILLANHYNTDVELLKKTYFNKRIEMSNFIEDETEINNYSEFLNSVEIPNLHISLSYSDLRATLEDIHEITDYALDVIKNSLEKLCQKGLVAPVQDPENKNIYWQSKVKNFALNDKNQNQVLNQFHHKTMDEVKEHLNSECSLSNKLPSIFLTLNQSGYDSFSDELEEFIQIY